MGEILAPGRSPGRNSAPQDGGQSTRLVKQLVVESCGARWLIDKYLRSSVHNGCLVWEAMLVTPGDNWMDYLLVVQYSSAWD